MCRHDHWRCEKTGIWNSLRSGWSLTGCGIILSFQTICAMHIDVAALIVFMLAAMGLTLFHFRTTLD